MHVLRINERELLRIGINCIAQSVSDKLNANTVKITKNTGVIIHGYNPTEMRFWQSFNRTPNSR